MARRRNDTGSVLLIFVAVVVAAVAVVGPFLIAGLEIIAEIRSRGTRSVTRASELISRAERDQIDLLEQRIGKITQRRNAIELRGDAAGLQRRSDGWFDARNTDGRDLNLQLEQLEAEKNDAVRALEVLKDQLSGRMSAWLGLRGDLIGARSALLVFVSIFVALTVSRLKSHGLPLSIPILLFGSGSDGSDRIFASALATLAAGLALWVGRSVARAALI